MTTATIQILDPRPEQKTAEREAARRLPSLSGKTIGLLDNRKFHSDNFLLELQSVLEEEYAVEKVLYLRKFSFSAPLRRRDDRRVGRAVRCGGARNRGLRELHGVGSPRHSSNRKPRHSFRERHH